jgi:hypothetical protein
MVFAKLPHSINFAIVLEPPSVGTILHAALWTCNDVQAISTDRGCGFPAASRVSRTTNCSLMPP